MPPKTKASTTAPRSWILPTLVIAIVAILLASTFREEITNGTQVATEWLGSCSLHSDNSQPTMDVAQEETVIEADLPISSKIADSTVVDVEQTTESSQPAAAVHDSSSGASTPAETGQQQPQKAREQSKADETAKDTHAANNKESELTKSEKEEENKELIACNNVVNKAKDYFDSGRFDDGINAMINCANIAPTSKNFWNVGVSYAKINKIDESIPWFRKCLNLDPKNATILQNVAHIIIQSGNIDEGAEMLEKSLEISLNLTTDWKSALIESIENEDYSWINSLQNAELNAMKRLLGVYTQRRLFQLSNITFSILAPRAPTDLPFQTQYSFFSMKSGLIKQGIDITIASLIHRNQTSPETIMKRSLLLLAAGIDAHIVSMTRNFILPPVDDEVSAMRKYCGEVADFIGQPAIKSSSVRDFFARCLLQQDVFSYLVSLGADVNQENSFGFSSLFHWCSLGNSQLLSTFMQLGPNILHRNNFYQTVLHTAVIRGQHNIVDTLVNLDATLLTLKDRKNRSPFDLACIHQSWYFHGAPSNHVFKQQDCVIDQQSRIIVEKQIDPLAAESGWILGEPTESFCDVDVRYNLTSTEFYNDYLIIGKPVLVKNALKSESWSALRAKWKQASFLKNYGHISVKNVSIPYAKSFGLEENATRIEQFIKYMIVLRNITSNDINNDESSPNYIFESFGGMNVLKRDMTNIPDFLDTQTFKISIQNPQFYVGGIGSGAPMHYHSGAVNNLIHGRKHWYLTPISHSIYTKNHPKNWVKNHLKTFDVPVLQCIQDASDVMFVPESWGHAVINLAESVGYASEFEFGQTQFAF